MLKLPPLAAIRAFEAAARHGSFTAAAAELGMTQAAVSYQIKQLEDRVGQPLFLRGKRKVTLSEAGQRLAPAVSEAFQRLSLAFGALRESQDGVLSVTVVNTFGTNWLVPRLGTFQMAHPDIAVRLDTSARIVDFAHEDVDVGIRAGKGPWPGLKMHWLMPVEFAVFASPDLMAGRSSVIDAADLLSWPLLDWTDDAWRHWFTSVGIQDPQHIPIRNIQVQTQQLLGSAALAGQGVALLTPAFFRSEIASGRLIQVHPHVARHEIDYWLVYPQERQNTRKIRAFRDWLLAEVEKVCGVSV
ncbi:transcriptional regulator GcvA [Dongia sp.]|uniref:transcriptional regulator GcvA n=1 Tax=Dongia sp. TaxID=1977262 RepID=UPI0035B4E676